MGRDGLVFLEIEDDLVDFLVECLGAEVDSAETLPQTGHSAFEYTGEQAKSLIEACSLVLPIGRHRQAMVHFPRRFRVVLTYTQLAQEDFRVFTATEVAGSLPSAEGADPAFAHIFAYYRRIWTVSLLGTMGMQICMGFGL